jgi:membrane-associated phospholipid phosphatase
VEENNAIGVDNERRAVLRTAALWLVFLAPFFYLTYGTANWLAAQKADVGDIAFGWEDHIPFVAWSILPYWSINLFYALSLFINDRPGQVGALARRYLTVQLIAVACFVAFPLKAIFLRPETSGIPGFMFDVLGGFDKPFNQAPSLHIALLVIIWDHLRGRFRGAVRPLWHTWCFLIGASVLATWQHHVMDIPTGLLLGFFALWAFPADFTPAHKAFRPTASRKARKLAMLYLAGAVAFMLLTVWLVAASPAALLLLWPSLALVIVAYAYLRAGPSVFQKAADGSISLASRWLLMPYRLGARINIGLWTSRMPASVEIVDGVHLGRFPSAREASVFRSVIDLTAEFPAPAGAADWMSIPTLDLVQGASPLLDVAAGAIEEHRRDGPVLVCCALGFQRSPAAVVHWLVMTGRAPDKAAALALVAAHGRRVHLPAEVETMP